MLGAGSVVVSDSLWNLWQIDAIYRLPSAVIVLPENDEACVTPVGGADPVTVGLCAEDLGEGAILHNRLQQASEVGDLEMVGAEAAAILVVRGLGSPPVVRAALRAGAMIIHDGHPWIASLCGFDGLFVPIQAHLPRDRQSAV